MFHKINKATIPLVWLFIYFLIGHGLLSNVVLCFGGDGHIAVEAVQSGYCDSAPGAISPIALNPAPIGAVSYTASFKVFLTQYHCGPCSDLPLLIDGSDQQYMIPVQNTIPQVKAPMSIAFPYSLPAFVTITTESFLPQFPVISSTLNSIRIVILRI